MNENEEKKDANPATPQPQPVYIPKSKWTPIFKFLCAARTTNENRYVLRRVYCDEVDDIGVLVASDGKRIHALYNVWSWGFTKGVQYSTTIDKDGISFIPITPPDGTIFPNWKSTMQAQPKPLGTLFLKTIKGDANSFITKASYLLGKHKSAYLNGAYLKDFCLFDGQCKLNYAGTLDPVVFSGTFGEQVEWKALIMPILCNPEEN